VRQDRVLLEREPRHLKRIPEQVLHIIIIIIIIIFIRTRSTQHEQIIQKIDRTVQQILKIKGE